MRQQCSRCDGVTRCRTPTPEIQLFCFGTMCALAVVYALHLLVFCPLLVIGERWQQRDEAAEASSGELARAEKVSARALARGRRATRARAHWRHRCS